MTNRTVALVVTTGLNRLPPRTAFRAAPTMLLGDDLTTRTGRGLLLIEDGRETLLERRRVTDEGRETALPDVRDGEPVVRRGTEVDGRGEVLTG